MSNYVAGLVSTVGSGAAGYFLVKHAAQAATIATDFGVKVAPNVLKYTTLAASKISAGFANAIATRAPIVGEKLVSFGRNFAPYANTSLVEGAVAGLGIGFTAFAFDTAMAHVGFLSNSPVTRIVVSHILAGVAVTGCMALAAKVGLIVAGLTLSGAITLTATALAITLVSRAIFSVISCCCGPKAPTPNKAEEKSQEMQNTVKFKSPSKGTELAGIAS